MWRVIGLDGKGDCWVFCVGGEFDTMLETANVYNYSNQNATVPADPNEAKIDGFRYLVCSQEEWESHWKDQIKESETTRAAERGLLPS